MQGQLAFGQRGLNQIAESGSHALRINKEGSLVVAQSAGKYVEAVREGRVFVAANQAAVALTAALATTYTGLVLVNPSNSGKDVVMLRFGYSFSVAVPTATVIGLMTGEGTSGIASAITPRNRLMGGGPSSMIVDNGATLPGTPVLEQVFGQGHTLATTGTAAGPITDIDLDGSLIVTPGSFVAVYSFAACTASFIGSFMWEEVPR